MKVQILVPLYHAHIWQVPPQLSWVSAEFELFCVKRKGCFINTEYAEYGINGIRNNTCSVNSQIKCCHLLSSSCNKIAFLNVIYRLLCRVGNELRYIMSSWPIDYALTRVLFWYQFPSLLRSSGTKHQNINLMSALTKFQLHVKHYTLYIYIMLKNIHLKSFVTLFVVVYTTSSEFQRRHSTTQRVHSCKISPVSYVTFIIWLYVMFRFPIAPGFFRVDVNVAEAFVPHAQLLIPHNAAASSHDCSAYGER